MLVSSAIQKIIKPNFSFTPKQLSRLGFKGCADSFERVISPKEICLKKLDKLFPDNSLIDFYIKMNQDFGIDFPPSLSFATSGTSKSNYFFERNAINLNLADCLSKEYKIVEKTQDGDKALFSMITHSPLFLAKEEAKEIAARYGEGFELVQMTQEEKRKLVLQTLVHNVIHSQQFMLIRKTKKLGAGEILCSKAGLKNFNQNRQQIGEELTKGTFWDKHQTAQVFDYESPLGRQALVWLGDLKYAKGNNVSCAMENDANKRAYNYIVAKFGDY